MTFDIDAIIESKRRYSAKLAALPIAEKLRMLEDLRARTLAIKASAIAQAATAKVNGLERASRRGNAETNPGAINILRIHVAKDAE